VVSDKVRVGRGGRGGLICCGGDTIVGGPRQKTTNSDPPTVKGRRLGGVRYCWGCVIFFACVCVGMSGSTTVSDDPSH
jgi:hypothetical protein